jgi:hypothetical protein
MPDSANSVSEERPRPGLDQFQLREEAIRIVGEDRVPSDTLERLIADFGDPAERDEVIVRYSPALYVHVDLARHQVLRVVVDNECEVGKDDGVLEGDGDTPASDARAAEALEIVKAASWPAWELRA